MATALQLISCDDKGKFSLGAEAMKVLRSIKGPVGVLSVCGRARQGKSFILNQIVAEGGGASSKGFEVGPTHRPCTKGLWMWSKPLPCTTPDGQNFHVILLDSEGIDAYDQTGQYSTQIFSLAVLLSSMFVYNQMGGIDEAALDRLSLVTEMTKHIQVRAGKKTKSASELGSFSPTFLWLLRDFYLSLSEDGEKITAKDYLETALQPVKGSSGPAKAKNQIRESIRELFPDRNCFTLVRPMNDEWELQNLNKCDPAKMRPEFRKGIGELMKVVFSKCGPKMMGTTVLTGAMLEGITQVYVDAINNGAVPTIATAWQGVAEQECRRAEEDGFRAYKEAFKAPEDPEELRDAHSKALEVALKAFQETAVGDPDIKQTYSARLKAKLDEQFESFQTQILAEESTKVVEMLQAMEGRLRGVSGREGATLETLTKALTKEVQTFEDNAKGPSKYNKLAATLANAACGGFLYDFSTRMIQSARDAHEAAEVKAAAAERAGASAEASFKSLQTALEARAVSAEKNVAQSQQAIAKAEKQLDESRRDVDKWQKKLEESRRDVDKWRVEAEKQGRSQAAAEAKVVESQAEVKRYESQTSRLQELNAALEEKLKQLQVQHAGVQSKAADAERQLLMKESTHSQISSEQSTQIHRLTTQVTEKDQRLDRLTTQVAEKDQRLELIGKQLADATSAVADLRRSRDAEKDAQIHANVAHTSEVNSLQLLLKQAQEEKESLGLENKRMKASVASAKTTAASASVAGEALKQTMEQKEAQLLEKERQLTEKQSLLAATQRLQVEAQKKADIHKKEYEAATKKESEMRAQLESTRDVLQKQLEEATKREADLRAQLDARPTTTASTPATDSASAFGAALFSGGVQAANFDFPEPEPVQEEEELSDRKGKKRKTCDSAPHQPVNQDEPPAKQSRASTRSKKGGASASASSGGPSPADSMTVQALRNYLTDKGYGNEVWAMKNAKKKDLVELYNKIPVSQR